MEKETLLNDFFTHNLDAFIRPSEEPLEDYFLGTQLIWTDYLDQRFKDIFYRDDVFIYTVVESDYDEAWILEGRHIPSRVGCFFTTKEIEIPDEGIRYW